MVTSFYFVKMFIQKNDERNFCFRDLFLSEGLNGGGGGCTSITVNTSFFGLVTGNS